MSIILIAVSIVKKDTPGYQGLVEYFKKSYGHQYSNLVTVSSHSPYKFNPMLFSFSFDCFSPAMCSSNMSSKSSVQEKLSNSLSGAMTTSPF